MAVPPEQAKKAAPKRQRTVRAPHIAPRARLPPGGGGGAKNAVPRCHNRQLEMTCPPKRRSGDCHIHILAGYRACQVSKPLLTPTHSQTYIPAIDGAKSFQCGPPKLLYAFSHRHRKLTLACVIVDVDVEAKGASSGGAALRICAPKSWPVRNNTSSKIPRYGVGRGGTAPGHMTVHSYGGYDVPAHLPVCHLRSHVL